MSVKSITDPNLMFPNPQVVKNDGTSSIAFGGLGVFLWIPLLALLRFGFGVRYSEALGAALLCVCFAVPAILHYRWVRRTEYHLSSEGLRVIRNGQTVFASSWQALRFVSRGLFKSSFWVTDGAGRRISIESLQLNKSGAHLYGYLMSVRNERVAESERNAWPSWLLTVVFANSAMSLVGGVVLTSQFQAAAVEKGGSNWVPFGSGALLIVVGLLAFLFAAAHLQAILAEKSSIGQDAPSQLTAFRRKYHGRPPPVLPKPCKPYRLKWEDVRHRELRMAFDVAGGGISLMGFVGLTSVMFGWTAKPVPSSSQWIMGGIVAIGALFVGVGRLSQRRRVHLGEATLTWDSTGNVTATTNTGQKTFNFEKNGRFRATDGTWCVIDTRYLEEVSRS